VLALHGSLTQSGMWVALAEAADSFRMLCPDQRGFGLSEDRGNDSCAEFASDALALGQELLPERYVVMGHSFACSIALEAAHMAGGRVAAVVAGRPGGAYQYALRRPDCGFSSDVGDLRNARRSRASLLGNRGRGVGRLAPPLAGRKANVADVNCELVHIPDQHPAEGIIAIAQQKGCDLIVMASHGRRAVKRLLLGSQVNEVLAHSKVPVLVVR
jgi:pimeloyl-ACP methyl ester carboxylesterase